MKTKCTLLFLVIILLQNLAVSFAQSTANVNPSSTLPPFVEELMQGAPPEEMRVTDPALYNYLQKKRMTFIGLLAKEIKAGRLPDSLMQAVMKPAQQVPLQPAIQTQTLQPDAANFKLTKDINTATNSSPGNYNGSYTSSFAAIGNTVYFQADDGVHGTELWSSDGTEAGTNLVKDINTGAASSYPGYIAVFKNKLYFSAYTVDYGYELYVSDGTGAGTKLLKDIAEGANSSNPNSFTILGNLLYFVSDGNGSYRNQIWKTNGTTNGTKLVQDLYATSNASAIFQFTAANGALYFTAYTYAYGEELWRSDGSSAGAYMVKDINPGNNLGSNYYYGGPINLTEFNGKLYFSAGTSSATLWQSDGTVDGTIQSKNDNNVTIYNIGFFAFNQPFAIANNTLYFGGYTPTTGNELYKYRPATGVTLVKDITPSGSSNILTEGIRSMGDYVYFSVFNYNPSINELWKSNGTSLGTSLVKVLPSDIGSYNFYSLNNNLYFSLRTDAGLEPWVSDGTSAGTAVLKDINNGPNSSSPALFSLAGTKVFFRAATDAGGVELWQTKGRSAGTSLVKDINTTATANGVSNAENYSNYYSTAIPLDSSKIVFNGYTPQTGYEIWVSNGNAAGTKLLKELVPNESSAYPKFFASKNGKAFFSGYNIGYYDGVFVTDGTTAGTKLIASTDGYVIDIDVADNGNVYFLFYSYTSYSYQLWKVKDDGSSLQQLKTICDYNMAVAGNTCFFSAYDAATGYELWKTGGTPNNTKLVKDINEGIGSSSPYNFVAFNNKVLFSSNYYNNYSLYVSDGTESGTLLLKNMYFYPYNSAAIAGGEFYFAGSDYNTTYGQELYKTDGTPEGTMLVKDIYTGSYYSSNPANITAVGNTIYFSANDGINGTELWKTKGNSASTRLVKDITPGINSSYLYSFSAAGGKLYFSNSGALWSTEGTAATTQASTDAGLANVQPINYILNTGDKIFLTGYSYKYGNELYEGDATVANGIVANAITSSLPVNNLSAKLLTNPFINNLVISIHSPKAQPLQITIYDVSGKQVITKNMDAAAGQSNLSLNVSALPRATYIISVSNGAEAVHLKAIK